MTQYLVRASNHFSSFHKECDTLHDARLCVDTIIDTNKILKESNMELYSFHGWVTEWKGYRLEDGGCVTESARPVLDF